MTYNNPIYSTSELSKMVLEENKVCDKYNIIYM